MKRYLVIGTDLVPAPLLLRLYNVDPAECVLTDASCARQTLDKLEPNSRSRLVRLLPRPDGDYRLIEGSRS